MDVTAIFAGLNEEQRRAVEAVRGPVCILAGAGSGKTTTITRRVANQVATGTFAAGQILAVTFTDKAATELRTRLTALGVTGVTARTFHAAALAELGVHAPPIPPDLMARVFREYERRKSAAQLVDFEDLLALAIALYDENEWALAAFRERYRAFTVDEYQDVNLLQQTLLDHWLGSSDEVCAVGDDYQAIYSFTGATPEYLLALPERFPHATIVRLEEMAILFRINARSADFEETLHAAEIPVQGASLLAREGARRLLKPLRGVSGPAAE